MRQDRYSHRGLTPHYIAPMLGAHQWVIDDAPGQLRTRLAASDNASQLALGHLIHQPPESASRGAWRGSGFELRSDGWLAVRAGEGILISATARPNAVSTQMDIVEAVGQMRAAEETAKALSDAARAQQALPLNANTKQSDFITALDPQKDGKFTAPVGGQAAKKAQAGSRELGDPTERFNEPAIVAEAPGDIALTSPASTLIFAGANLHATIQQDLHLAAAHTLAVTVGETASWFSHSGGIKSIAEAGSHTIHAHTDQLEILADQSVTVTSANDEIHILANKQIRLVGGQSSVTLEGSNITFACPGTFSVKGSSNAFTGPGSGAAVMEALPEGKVAEATHFIELDYRHSDLTPVVGAPYQVRFADGTSRSGSLDANGFARIEDVPNGLYSVVYGEDTRPAFARLERGSNALQGASAATQDEAKSLIDKYLAQEDDFLKENYFNDEIAAMAAEMPEFGGSSNPEFEHYYMDYQTRQELDELAAQTRTYEQRHDEAEGDSA